MPKSKAAFALSRSGRTGEQIGERVGVTGRVVSKWILGTSSPTMKSRVLVERAFGIPRGDWDVDHEPKKSRLDSLPSNIGVDYVEPGSSLERIIRTEQMADALMKDVQDDPDASFIEKSKVLSQLTTTLDRLARMKGEGAAELRVTRHPKFLEAQRLIVEALEEFPDALIAVRDAFAKVSDTK